MKKTELCLAQLRLLLLFAFCYLLTSPTQAAQQQQQQQLISPRFRPGFAYTRVRGKCTPQYWSSRTESWPKMVPQMSTLSNVFGSRVFERYRYDLTLLEATSRSDDIRNAFARLVKESSAALINSYARKGYPYLAWEVKGMVIQGLVSKESASFQAQRFRQANEACNHLHL